MEKPLIPEEVAEYLKCSVHSVREKARKRILPMRKIGKRWLILPSELRAWYDSQQKTSSVPK